MLASSWNLCLHNMYIQHNNKTDTAYKNKQYNPVFIQIVVNASRQKIAYRTNESVTEGAVNSTGFSLQKQENDAEN